MKVFHFFFTFFPDNVAVLAIEEKRKSVLIWEEEKIVKSWWLEGVAMAVLQSQLSS